MKKMFTLRALCAVALMAACGSVMAQEIPPRPLLNVAAKDAAARLVPSSGQVTVAASTQGGAPGLVVTMSPGPEGWPGVKLVPDGEPVWNLAQWGHIEAKITNTGSKPLRLSMRVDGQGESRDRPWNTEAVTIPEGKTADLKVIFGHSDGFNPGYPVKPDAVVRLLLFTGKVTEEQSFRIKSLVAAGPPGEKHINSINAQRIKPKGGVILGSGVKLDAAKQIVTSGGVSASAEGQALDVQFPAAGSKQLVRIKPEVGRWHLGDATEVRVKLTNTGKSAATPTVEVVSEQVNGVKATGSPLAPGATGEIVVPFAPAVPWQGVSAAERKGNHDSKPGTGTAFASDKTDGIIITAEHAGAAALRVESVIATTAVATLPQWVGQRPPVEGEWVKVFEDNFDTAAVDTNKWNITGPNYWDAVSHWSKDNVIIGGGVVRMRSEKKTGYQNDDPKAKQTDVQGGYMDTVNKFSQLYGYYEARMKLPTAPGLWPAFWMMPDRGPNSGDAPGSKKNRMTTRNGGMEFDIMEYLTIWGPHRYNIALHWDDYDKDHKAIGTGKIYAQTDKDGFVTSGLLWLPGQAIFYCNGVEVGRWEDPRVANVPAYIIFTMPMGGWDGNRMDGTGLPDDFIIDYVRVWQRKDLMAK